MVKKLVAVFSLAVLLGLLAGCQVQSAPTGSGGNTVTMGATTYTSGNTITIKKGETITFTDDKNNGSPHILVIGVDGAKKLEAGAPDFGTNGMSFQAGESKTTSPWMTPGTYHVTCTVHPTTMNLTVTVTA
ncbi:MAG TPA: plastocyanin/azurin family copper-binding protein [Ktedonobacterales bacterium]|jgi:plastocyanin